jgi:3-hydroxymyristoyl/3-hydroxydecanoyl-(acyl carrier protein) dehydratase
MLQEQMVKDCTVTEQHPCTRGHFPGQPLVPGAYLLARIEELILEDLPGYRLVSMRKVKFLKPLQPGIKARLSYSIDDGGKVRFSISDDADRVMEGSGSVVPL